MLIHRDHRWRVRLAVTHSVALANASLVAYLLTASGLAHVHSVSRDDDMIGRLWAVIATLFVYRYSYDQSVAAALSRVVATLVSFALCLAYLLILPFSPWGMAILIGLSALGTTLMGRSDETIIAAITTAVVMVAAGRSPNQAWEQPILRLADTIVGVAVGFASAWIAVRVSRWNTGMLTPVDVK